MDDILNLYDQKGEHYRRKLAKRHASESRDAKDLGSYHGTWQFEKMMLSLIHDGEVERLRKFFRETAQDKDFNIGTLASDPLRQAKNMVIGLIAIVGKIAGIGGGMDVEDAYRLIDLYTQECENAGSIEDVYQLQYNMVMDFTEQVRQARLPQHLSQDVFYAVQFIADHSHESIGINEVAVHVNRSRSFITRSFRKEIGKSITEYITDVKIREAKRLLLYSNRSISDVANTLAFSSQAYFQTVFKKNTGQTPGEYRRKNNSG